ncbi:30S ribosomal protein S21 [Bacteroidetes bacterium endosymbiont of Geopemphigus sp.]|uniref:30S ribosomal protein S21 n=1 Tax=Bacteroidetes bacterium endosymbiont of Geopemphigus sp. TaxID=2047937 RepID=UPI000CD277E9|nr:30S ribosomal protein S21 [Bacteroidetes bacterium endosymbiont of Geopemphigus sp.]
MLIVNIKEGESIERALKRYKRKCDQTRLIKNFRKIQYYIKPSIKRREEILKATYKQHLTSREED